ncbi:MAG: hypothetical protein MZW92_04890 [Comamonadaceae bacterium]|nr:hypothetical protein [Comamonadaceae bacterium]
MQRLAAALQTRLGVGAGRARGAGDAKNCAAYVGAAVRVLDARARAAVPINAKLHPKEVAFILDDADVRASASSPTTSDTAAIELRRSRRAATSFIDVDRPEYARAASRESRLPAPRGGGDDPALALLHQRHHRPAQGRDAHAPQPAGDDAELPGRRRPRRAPASILLHAAPMSHGSGLYTLPNIAVGATQLVPASRGFDVAEIDALLACAPRGRSSSPRRPW